MSEQNAHERERDHAQRKSEAFCGTARLSVGLQSEVEYISHKLITEHEFNTNGHLAEWLRRTPAKCMGKPAQVRTLQCPHIFFGVKGIPGRELI